ncbi:MAG: hypothetical protein GY857_14465 [Desulfobacula sp.]|nr:hypothetical protein [Desulfobacula sp.]
MKKTKKMGGGGNIRGLTVGIKLFSRFEKKNVIWRGSDIKIYSFEDSRDNSTATTLF